jgi:glycosyltransferase involved in cell wall biosynthesis
VPTSVRHVAIEASRLLQEKRGIGRYVRNVLREIVRQQPGVRLTLHVAGRDDVAPMRRHLDDIVPGLGLSAHVDTLEALPTSAADVVWYPWNFIARPAARATMVVTTLDLAPMLQHDGRWWKVLKRVKYRRRYARSVRCAHGIITISEFSRAEIARHLGVHDARVAVTLLAADDLPAHLPDDHAPLERAGITGPFFLTVGGQEGRKNLSTLYAAMEQLWAAGSRIPLVQCGPVLSNETRAKLGSAPWLHHVGYVSDAQLVSLYRRALALVYPSRYEGFGLPILEAMRAGAPVICADASSLPEVAGDAALMAPWHDVAAFATHMTRVAQDQLLRASLRSRGRAHAESFSWARTAQQTFAQFQLAHARHAGVSPVMTSPLAAPAPERAAARLVEARNG